MYVTRPNFLSGITNLCIVSEPHQNHWDNKIWVHLTTPGGGSKYIFEKLSDSGNPTGEITEEYFVDDAEIWLEGLEENTLYQYSVSTEYYRRQ